MVSPGEESLFDVRHRSEVGQLAAQIASLRRWVLSPGFAAWWGKGHRRRLALREIHALRARLVVLQFQRDRHLRDVREWADALAWAEADREEIHVDMLESLGRAIPRWSGETDADYVNRLREFRHEIARPP